jgi:hypothetical protein
MTQRQFKSVLTRTTSPLIFRMWWAGAIDWSSSYRTEPAEDVPETVTLFSPETNPQMFKRYK